MSSIKKSVWDNQELGYLAHSVASISDSPI